MDTEWRIGVRSIRIGILSVDASAVVSGRPVNQISPSITGTPEEGKVLTEVRGTWNPAPTGFSFKWMRCDASGNNPVWITEPGGAKATLQKYTIVAADVGSTIRVEETASNPSGSSSPAPSIQTAVVVGVAAGPPVNTAVPTIAGTAEEGKTLALTQGTWTNNPTSRTWQWFRGASAIVGATATTYTIIAADVGSALHVEETVANAAGSKTASSTNTAVVTAVPQPPSNTAVPTITGTPEVGKTLTIVNGTWTNTPTSYTHKWFRGTVEIAGQTGQTYVAQAADVGKTIHVEEVATNSVGSGTPVISANTSVVVAAPSPPVNSASPTISGTPEDGQTLTLKPGTWMNNPTSFSRQWFRENTSVAGATGLTYVLAAADVTHQIKAQETASNAAGSSAPASTALTGVVAAKVVGANAALGEVKYRPDLKGQWDPYSSGAIGTEWKPWLNAHFDGGLTYINAWTSQLNANIIKYADYWGHSGEGWGLGGTNGTESGVASTSATRAAFISHVQTEIAAGNDGIFMDDINFGPKNWPLEATQTHAAYEAELGLLVEEVRTAVGLNVQVSVNPQMHHIWPFVQANDVSALKILKNASSVDKEWGIGYNSSWPAGMATANKLIEYFAYVDRLHELGCQIELTGAGEAQVTQAEFEYHLAAYFLGNNQAINLNGRKALGGDYLQMSNQYPKVTKVSEFVESPTVAAFQWWTGLDVKLGAPLTARTYNSGLWTREYEKGIAYASDPAHADIVVTPPAGSSWRNIEGTTVASVTLKSRTVGQTLGSGIVLLR